MDVHVHQMLRHGQVQHAGREAPDHHAVAVGLLQRGGQRFRADQTSVDEEKLMEDALEAGASDFITDEDVFIVRTEPNDLSGVRDDLSDKGYKFVSAEIAYVPSTYVKLTDEEDLKMMGRLLDMLEESGVKHLTICSIDACNPGFAISRLIENGQVDKMITTHIGTNPVAQKLLAEGKLEVEFFPMGSFIEKMRDGGAGIGGFLTKTGLGTDMEKGKQIVTTSDGERYILEEAIHADVALTRCRRADPLGNLAYHGTGTASHPVMATCADISIVQCDLYCDLNEISPDDVKVPAMYVDMLYTDSREQNQIIGRIKRNQLEGM